MDWKSANVTALHKRGKKSCVSNDRPVNLTSIVCKIFESIVRDHILNYFFVNKLFTNKQYGFIRKRSTVLQLLKILDDWTECLEKGGQIDVVYTDFEKAFDKVSHNMLIRKLRNFKLNDQLAIQYFWQWHGHMNHDSHKAVDNLSRVISQRKCRINQSKHSFIFCWLPTVDHPCMRAHTWFYDVQLFNTVLDQDDIDGLQIDVEKLCK